MSESTMGVDSPIPLGGVVSRDPSRDLLAEWAATNSLPSDVRRGERRRLRPLIQAEFGPQNRQTEDNPLGVVVVCAYNEGKALEKFLEQLRMKVQNIRILVVDDGSDDNTCAMASYHSAVTVRNERNVGKLASVHRAFREATSLLGFTPSWFVTCDADGQHTPESVVAVVKELEDGRDIVFTSRFGPQRPRKTDTIPLDRSLLTKAVVGMIDAVVPWGLTDPLCGLRGFQSWVVTWILQQTFVTDHYGHELETLLRLWDLRERRHHKFSFVELPIPAVYNGTGKIEHIYEPEHLPLRAERAKLHLIHISRVLDALGVHDLS